jgi:hypothetical protein
MAKNEIIKRINVINRSNEMMMHKNYKFMEIDTTYTKKNKDLLKSKDETLKTKEAIIKNQDKMIRRLEEKLEGESNAEG